MRQNYDFLKFVLGQANVFLLQYHRLVEEKNDTTINNSLKEAFGTNNNMIVNTTKFGGQHVLHVSPYGRRGFEMIILTPNEES